MMTFRSICAKCLGDSLHKSRLRPIDVPFSLFGFVAVRCRACNTRFQLHRLALRPVSFAPADDSQREARAGWKPGERVG